MNRCGLITALHRIAQSPWLAVAMVFLVVSLWAMPAWASLKDDHYDGNIFALYAGNGALVPAKETITMALERQKPVFLVFYIDDSQDCKEFSPIVSQIQAFFGKLVSIIPVDIDTIPPKDRYSQTEPGYYYQGLLPQVVILDQRGQVVFDQVGQVPFGEMDKVLRQILQLSENPDSQQLQPKAFNEVNTELTSGKQSGK